MATVAGKFARGLKLTGSDGTEKTLVDFVLREATSGDVMEGTEESEKAVLTPDGYQLIVSPSRLGLAVLRRQIVSIGDVKGPISIAELKRLSTEDMKILQAAAEELELAASKQVAEALGARGRAVSAAE